MATETRPSGATAPAKTATGLSYRAQQALEVWTIRVVMVLVTLASLFPSIYVVLYSFKGGGSSLFSSTFIPKKLTLDNYTKLLSGNFPYWVRNSLIIGLFAGAIAVLLASFAGYAFSRMRFRGRTYGILGLLEALSRPPWDPVPWAPATIALAVAVFLLSRTLVTHARRLPVPGGLVQAAVAGVALAVGLVALLAWPPLARLEACSAGQVVIALLLLWSSNKPTVPNRRAEAGAAAAAP